MAPVATTPFACRRGPAPPRQGSTEPQSLQCVVVEAEEMPGLVQQGGPDLLAQLIFVVGRPLEVAAKQHDLREPRLAAQPARAVAVGGAGEEAQRPRIEPAGDVRL